MWGGHDGSSNLKTAEIVDIHNLENLKLENIPNISFGGYGWTLVAKLNYCYWIGG